jgi:hypothetical protein
MGLNPTPWGDINTRPAALAGSPARGLGPVGLDGIKIVLVSIVPLLLAVVAGHKEEQ